MLRLGVWPQGASGVDGLASRSVWRESLERALREHAPACAGGIRRAARRTNDRLAGSRQPIPWCPKAMHSSYVIRAAATKDEGGLRQLVSFQSRNGWGNPGLRGSAAACLARPASRPGAVCPQACLYGYMLPPSCLGCVTKAITPRLAMDDAMTACGFDGPGMSTPAGGTRVPPRARQVPAPAGPVPTTRRR